MVLAVIGYLRQGLFGLISRLFGGETSIMRSSSSLEMVSSCTACILALGIVALLPGTFSRLHFSTKWFFLPQPEQNLPYAGQ